MVAHPRISLIPFTGSSPVGRRIAEVAGRTLKHVSLELGGKNPVIVLPDADLELVADGLLWGAFGTAGQRCTASSRLIAVGDVSARLLPQLVARALDIGVRTVETHRLSLRRKLGVDSPSDLLKIAVQNGWTTL